MPKFSIWFKPNPGKTVIVKDGNSLWHDELLSTKCTNPITLILADKQTLFREGLKTLLSRESDIQVLGEADTGQDALQLCVERCPSLLVMDFAMPVMDAFEVAHAIQKMKMDIQIILIAGYLEVRDLAQFISLGIRGFICKQDDYQSVSLGIRVVHSGKVFFSDIFNNYLNKCGYQELLRWPKFRKNWKCLSVRERETLKLISVGKSNKQMASLLEISIKTVEKHREKLMNKLDIHDTAGLVRYSFRSGIVEMAMN